MPEEFKAKSTDGKEFINKHFRKHDTPPAQRGDAQRGIEMHEMFNDMIQKGTAQEPYMKMLKDMLDSENETSRALSKGPLFFIDEQMDFMDHEGQLTVNYGPEPQDFTVEFLYTRPYATSPIKETVVVNASTLSEAKQLIKEKFPTITSFNKIMTEDGKSH